MLPIRKDVQKALDSGEIKLYGIEAYLIARADPEFSKKLADKKSLPKQEWDAMRAAWEDVCNRGAEYRRDIIAPRGEFSEFATKGPYFNLGPSLSRIENPIGTAKIPVREVAPIPVMEVSPSALGAGQKISETFRPRLAVSETVATDLAYGSQVLASSRKQVESLVTKDGIARSILLLTDGLSEAYELDRWLLLNAKSVQDTVNASDPFCKLKDVTTFPIGSRVYARFILGTGDAMGMNMATQAAQDVGSWIEATAPKEYGVVFETVSANMCVDKKASALDHLLGRGKTVSSRVVLSDKDLEPYGVSSRALFNQVVARDWMYRDVPASQRCRDALDVVCGFFVHGQDLAQTVESSNCQTYVRLLDAGSSLEYMVELPSLEIATFGGGATTPSAQEYLDMIGCKGAGKVVKLAEIISATVLASELGRDLHGAGAALKGPEATLRHASKTSSGIAEIPVGAAGPFDGHYILLGTTETALVGAVNAGLKAITDHQKKFETTVSLVQDHALSRKTFDLYTKVEIPSSYFEADKKHRTTALRIANLVREKCWDGSGKAGGYFGSENTNIANSVAAIHVAYGQPLNLIRNNSQGSIRADVLDSGALSFRLSLPRVQVVTNLPLVNKSDMPAYAVQALKELGCYGPGNEAEFVRKVYAPAVTGLELRTTWTQAAGTLARAHTGMTKK